MWCKNSSCPICFIHGWSSREARNIEARLDEAVKRGLGKVEHLMVSIPLESRDLPEPVMREMCRRALLDRGVSGGCMLFHGFREDKSRHVLAWSAHYHVLEFIQGGYTCRDCRKVCSKGCGGFINRSYRCFESDRCIVKVHDERKTIIGTAHYQLHHATIHVGIRRFRSVTWFGSASCRKFRAVKHKAECPCPACGQEMVKSFYVGHKVIVKDIGNSAYVPVFLDDEFDAFGRPNYVDIVGSRFE